MLISLVVSCSNTSVQADRALIQLDSEADSNSSQSSSMLFNGKPMKQLSGVEYKELFFATDRKELKRKSGLYLSGERGKLVFGKALVSIPVGKYKTGQVDFPFSWGDISVNKNPERNVVFHDYKLSEQRSIFSELKQSPLLTENGDLLLFVHGYNVRFDTAARLTRQLQYDLSFEGLPLFYSWPSKANFAEYVADEANVRWAESNFQYLLAQILLEPEVKNIYLISHSMGNRAVMGAVTYLLESQPESAVKFKALILASPDVDTQIFERDIAPVLVAHNVPVTLYTSSRDSALKASKVLHGDYSRVGDSGEHIFVFSGIDTIDSSNVSSSQFGHSDYLGVASVLEDMKVLISEGTPVSQRKNLEAVEVENVDIKSVDLETDGSSQARYWRIIN